MIRFIPLKIIVIVIAISAGLPFFLLQQFYDADFIRNFFRSVTIAVFLLAAINSTGLWRSLWRINPKWFNKNIFPDVQGTYSGKLISSYNGGTEIPEASLIVKQSLLHIKVKQITGESHSFSKIADIVYFDRDINIFKLYYIYLNEPRDSVRDRSLPHIGAADLSIILDGKNIKLEGRYFNDPKSRATTGEMQFTRTNRQTDF